MDSSAVTHWVSWVITHGYALFFLATFFEGPLITAAAGVAAALGYYNIEVVIGIAIIGDLIADCGYFAIGYFAGRTFILRYGKRIGITNERIEKIQKLLHGHTRKAVAIIKLSPLIPIPGILILGSVRVSFKKFFEMAALITIPKSTLFALVGFFSGKAYMHLNGSVMYGQYVLWGVVLIIITVFVVYQKISRKISKEIQ